MLDSMRVDAPQSDSDRLRRGGIDETSVGMAEFTDQAVAVDLFSPRFYVFKLKSGLTALFGFAFAFFAPAFEPITMLI